MQKSLLIISVLYLLIACSASDNVFNDGGTGGDPTKSTPPIVTPTPVVPGLPGQLSINKDWVNTKTAPELSWVNPTEEDYHYLEVKISSAKENESEWSVVPKGSTSLSLKSEFDECGSYQYELRSILGVEMSESVSSRPFRFDSVAPEGFENITAANDALPSRSASSSYDKVLENCELSHVDYAISKTKDESGIVNGGSWLPVGGRPVFRENLSLVSFKGYYTIFRAFDKAGNTSKVFSSEQWCPLGPLSAVKLKLLKAGPKLTALKWSNPKNRNHGRGDAIKFEIWLREKGKKWKQFTISNPMQRFYSFADLNPGNYEIKIRSYNLLWSDFSNAVKFKVLPYSSNPGSDEGQFLAHNIIGGKKTYLKAFKDNTLVHLNGKMIGALSSGGELSFVSKAGDIVTASQTVEVYSTVQENKTEVEWIESDFFGNSFDFELNNSSKQRVFLKSLSDQDIIFEASNGELKTIEIEENEIKSFSELKGRYKVWGKSDFGIILLNYDKNKVVNSRVLTERVSL